MKAHKFEEEYEPEFFKEFSKLMRIKYIEKFGNNPKEEFIKETYIETLANRMLFFYDHLPIGYGEVKKLKPKSRVRYNYCITCIRGLMEQAGEFGIMEPVKKRFRKLIS